jgi:HK97 gp10 family phage protein
MIKQVIVKNLDEVLANLKKTGAVVEINIPPALKAAAEPIYREARAGAVNIRRTGTTARELKTSNVYLEGKNLAIDIGFEKNTRAWYAHFPEFGTVHSAARPFMRPAFDRKRKDSEVSFSSVIRGSIGRI